MYFFGASLAAAHLRVSTCKRGDRISHDVKGPGPNIQPAILIRVAWTALPLRARTRARGSDKGIGTF